MSLALRARLALLTAALLGPAIHLALTAWPLPALSAWAAASFKLKLPVPQPLTAALMAAAITLPVLLWLAAAWLAPLRRLARSLEGAVLSYRDGDFSLNLGRQGPAELDRLLQLHAEMGSALREQRQHLAQRELLLDTVVQNTPVALLLTGPTGKIAIANLAARQLLGDGRSLVGQDFDTLAAGWPAPLQEALAGEEDRLFNLTLPDGAEETFHLSQRSFRLQGQPHRLRLLRRLTRELSRAEVATWKRVIRVISHELNNSLAPISSLAHSGAELARRGASERLPGVFELIGERAGHLHGFLSGYARFAKLPAPALAWVSWASFVAGLRGHAVFELAAELPAKDGHFDAGQIEQALLNLFKNAHEAGGPPEQVRLRVHALGPEWRLEVQDRGPGMSELVLSQALLPFYSTKRAGPGGGTGLGLALAREIAEAHGGRLTLANRRRGGLKVTIHLPQAEPLQGRAG